MVKGYFEDYEDYDQPDNNLLDYLKTQMKQKQANGSSLLGIDIHGDNSFKVTVSNLDNPYQDKEAFSLKLSKEVGQYEREHLHSVRCRLPLNSHLRNKTTSLSCTNSFPELCSADSNSSITISETITSSRSSFFSVILCNNSRTQRLLQTS